MSATGFSQQTEVTGTLSAFSGYVAGETIEIPFNIDFENIDEEYVDLLELTFPAGVTIEGVSNDNVFIDNEILFGVGAPNADYNGISGQTVSWGDDNNVFGGIFTSATINGELTALSYDFTVTITVDAGTTGDLLVDFFASGDEFGPNPADLTGSVTIGEGVSVYGIVVNSADHTVLELAVNTAGLQAALGGAVDPMTLFAPTDAAFTTFLTDNGLTAEELLANPELANILLYHALGISAPSSGLTDGQVVETLLTGQSVTIGVVADPFAVTVNGENVSVPDLAGSNGIVHVIDGVLTLPISIPVGFEASADLYNIEGFGGAENTGIVPNPDATGANTSDNVWQQTQDPAAAQLFAGAVLTLDAPIPFNETARMAMEVWTPAVGDQVTLKIEQGGGDEFEVVVESTVAGEWETMVFDFTGEFDPAIDYPRVVVFFNNGSANIAETYYADNIRMASIFDIVVTSDVHTTLETALLESGLDAVVEDAAADLTLFAPTDAAFDALPDGVLTSLLADPTGALVNVLLYHVVGGTALSGDLSDGQEILTAQGETVTVAIDGGVITINGAEVIIADLEASNGVVHVIDAVLVPELCTSVSAVYSEGLFATDGDVAPAAVDGVCPIIFSDFQSWASEAYIVNEFVEGTTYTFGLSGGDIGAWVPQLLVQSQTTGEVIASGAEGDLTLSFEVPEAGTYRLIVQEVGSCGEQSGNLDTDNGFPFLTCESSVTITEIVVNSDIHTTLETAVIAAGLDGTLAGEGPFTVFAPTDDAFDLLPEGLLADLLADPTGDLTTILTHHVANGIAYSTDLTDGQSIPTLQGEDVTVGVGAVVTITSSTGVEAEVTVANIIASNGVVHVIDAVLIPTLTSVENLTSVDEIKVFPNPTNNQFTLDLELNASERVTVDLVNIVGQVVKSVDLGTRSVGLNREYIDVNDLSEGIYFMNLTVGDTQGTVKVQVVR
jgi:uncharacterized surface protein with fasciclin (FAS1) repeats